MEKKILLIDDDQNEQRVFLEALHKLRSDANCIFARNAELAFKTLNFLTPDFIFLNMHLPTMNGLACLARIKELKHLRSVPVLLYSTSFSDAIKEKAIAMGAASCIRKPSTVNVLMHILNRLISSDGKQHWTWNRSTAPWGKQLNSTGYEY